MLKQTQRNVNLFVVHETDTHALGALKRMAELAEGRAIDPFVWIAASGDGPADRASVVGASSESLELSEILSGVRVLDRVRLVTVMCSNSDDLMGDDLSRAARSVRLDLQEVKAAQTSIIEVRVQAIEAEDFTPAKRLFSHEAVANVVIIPHDRLSDTSAARWVSESMSDRYESHIAIELCSLVSSWVTVGEAPIDSWKPSGSASGETELRFVRSLVRSLVCPPLPVDQIVSEQRPLPVPDGYFPSPQPASTIRVVAQRTFPSELRFVRGEEPDLRVEVGLGEASREIPKRFFKIIRNLPTIFKDGISRDLESIQGDGLQEIIGRDAWLSIMFRDRQSNAESVAWADRLDNAVIELEQLDDMPILARLPESVWERLLVRPFGVADGSGESEDALAETGEAQYLVTDPRALTVAIKQSAESTIEELLDALDSADSEQPDQFSSPNIVTADAISSTVEDLVVPVQGSTWESPKVTDGEDADLADSEQQTDGADDSENPQANRVDDRTDEGPAKRVSLVDRMRADSSSLRASLAGKSSQELPPGGLVGVITKEFVNQRDAAERWMKQMIGEIREIAEESRRDSESRDVPLVAQFLLGGALVASLFSIFVFTGLAEYSDLSFLSSRTRQILWVLGAAAVVGTSATVKWGASARGRIELLIFGVLLGVAFWMANLPSLRYSQFVLDNVGTFFWPIWPPTVVVVGIGLYTRFSTGRALGSWRAATARFLGWGSVGFGLAVAIVASSNYRSIVQPVSRFPVDKIPRYSHWVDGLRMRVLIWVLALSFVAALVALVIIGLIWVRVEFRNRSRNARFMFALSEARSASRARRRLQLITTQWLGSAAAMSRIMWYPLGRVDTADDLTERTYSADETLLKFQAATLELTPRGEEILLARLRTLLVQPGWLTNQYRRAAESFMAAEPSIIASELHPDEWPSPQSCEAAPGLDEVLDGIAEGRRWSFMRSLYDGVLDSALQEAVTDYSPAEIFSTILGTKQAANTVSHVENEVADPDKFFESLLPEGRQELPSGLVSMAFMAGDDRRSLRSYVSWPHELVPMEISDCDELGHVNSLGISGAVITAVRCDISGSFKSSEVGTLNTVEDDGGGVEGFTGSSDL